MSPSCPNPRCRSEGIMHRWQADMASIKIIDDYKCLKCGHHWTDETTYHDLMAMTRKNHKRWRYEGSHAQRA